MSKRIQVTITNPDLSERTVIVVSEAQRRRLHAQERAALCAALNYSVDAIVTTGEMIGELRRLATTGRRFA